MHRISTALIALAAAAGPAFAHPGHVLENGDGHGHVAAAIILAVIGVGAAAIGAVRIARTLRSRALSRA